MTPDEAGVLVDALGDAFAAADVQAVVDCFADDGDVLYAGSEAGETASGLAALRVLLDELFARPERYRWRSERVQVVACAGGGHVVLAEASLEVHQVAPTREDAAVEVVPYRVSGLLEGSPGAWRWRFCHGSEPAPQAQSAPSDETAAGAPEAATPR